MSRADELIASHSEQGHIETSEEQKPLGETVVEPFKIPDKYWLDVSKPIKEDIYLLRHNGIGFSPLGDIQALRGMEGNGKSFLFSMYMAAILKGEYGTLTCDIPNASCMYIDTEQHENNVLKVAARVNTMVGWPIGYKDPRFKVLTLREEDDTDTIQQIVKTAIMENRPTGVFLDGIVDTVRSKNDEADSKQWIRQLMKMASELNISIWNVLHVNYGSDKMSGHLGTELAHKASDVMSCQKDKTMKPAVFTVEQVKARNRDIENLTFQIDDVSDGKGGKIGIPIITTIRDLDSDTETNRGERDELMKEVFGDRHLNKTDAIFEIQTKRFSGGSDSAKKHAKLWFEQAAEWGIITTDGSHKWYYRGLYADPLRTPQPELPIPGLE